MDYKIKKIAHLLKEGDPYSHIKKYSVSGCSHSGSIWVKFTPIGWREQRSNLLHDLFAGFTNFLPGGTAGVSGFQWAKDLSDPGANPQRSLFLLESFEQFPVIIRNRSHWDDRCASPHGKESRAGERRVQGAGMDMAFRVDDQDALWANIASDAFKVSKLGVPCSIFKVCQAFGKTFIKVGALGIWKSPMNSKGHRVL